MEYKKCADCGETKPITEFSKNGIQRGKQAYKARCKPCYSKYKSAYRIQKEKGSPEIAKRRVELQRRRALSDKDTSIKRMISNSRYRAKRKQLEFNLHLRILLFLRFALF